MYPDAKPAADIAVPAHRHEPVDKIGWFVGKRQRVPSEPVWRRRCLVERRAADQAIVDPAEWRVHRRRPDAIEPSSPVLGAWCGERRARDLLGVETAGRPLRRILALGQRARQRLGGMLVAETGKVAEPLFSHCHFGSRPGSWTKPATRERHSSARTKEGACDQTTPSRRSVSTSAAPNPSQSLSVSVVCSPSNGAGLSGATAPSKRTGQVVIVIFQSPCCIS